MSDTAPTPAPEPDPYPPVPPAPPAAQPGAYPPAAPAPQPAPPAGQPGAYPQAQPQQPGAYPPPAYGAPAAPAPYGSTPAYGAAPGYGAAPAYGAAPGYGYGAPAKTNTLAIISLIASISSFVILPFIGSIVGVITGHMSLKQLKTSGEQGRGMALAGTIVGWVGLGLTVIGILLAILFITLSFAAYSTSGSYS